MAQVLLHTLVFAPDSVSTSYLMSDLVRELTALGHTVEVLTTTPHYNLDPESIRSQDMQRRAWGLFYQGSFEGVPVWHVTMPQKGDRVSARTLDYLRFHATSVIVGRLFCRPFDIIIAPSPPLSIGIVGWLLGVSRRAPFVYNLQEIYPDFAINQGIVKGAMQIRLFRSLERLVYLMSTRIVSISPTFKSTLLERNVADKKVVVIPNFVDTTLYQPLPRENDFARSHGLVGKFVVMYGGNIGLSQDWEMLLQAASSVSDLPILFAVAGDGVKRTWLEGEILRRSLRNVVLLGYQSRKMMPLVNASSDIGTIPMKALTNSDTFPSKIYTIFACGKTAVVSAEPGSDLAMLVEETGAGQVTIPGHVGEYAQAIRSSYHQREDLAAKGDKARAFVEQRYSRESVGRMYDSLIRELTPHVR